MGSSINNYSDYIRFYFITKDKPAYLVKNVLGWREQGLNCKRNEKYHGTLVKVSDQLGFNGEDLAFLQNEYKLELASAEVWLLVEKLNDIGGILKWHKEEFIKADFLTRNIKDKTLFLNFYSSSLQTKIDSYENQNFEVERVTDINNKTIAEINTSTISLEGRSIVQNGLSNISEISVVVGPATSSNFESVRTIPSKVDSQGNERQSYSSSNPYNTLGDFPNISASNLFFDNAVTNDDDIDVSLKVNIELFGSKGTQPNNLILRVTEYDSDSATYSIISDDVIATGIVDSTYVPNFAYNNPDIVDTVFSYEKTIKWNQGICLCWESKGPNNSFTLKGSIEMKTIEVFSASDCKVILYNDVLKKLLEIITGKQNSFYSSVLDSSVGGRLSKIAVTSGLYAREFQKSDPNYKSIKGSISYFLDSISNVFNLGSGVESDGLNEFLVLEELDYFYKEDVKWIFEEQVDESLVEDKNSYYSKLKFGFSKTETTSTSMGLDEPNLKNEFTTHIEITDKEFSKLSEVRADEYALEKLRRDNKYKKPNESYSNDHHCWFLDLILDGTLRQANWFDRLSQIPTGIHSPETFHSMLFSPSRILLRNSSIFNSGLYNKQNNFVNFASSNSNVNLKMNFIDDNLFIKENDNIQISELKTPFFKNEIAEFEYAYSEELKQFIFGSSEVNYKGNNRIIPNFYFKMRWTNQFNETKSGYLLEYSTGDLIRLKFQVSNEEII
tara:strand:- start:1119 stop:3296 length:2178 start_codon:yes stop_codon:yes gene_type:complete